MNQVDEPTREPIIIKEQEYWLSKDNFHPEQHLETYNSIEDEKCKIEIGDVVLIDPNDSNNGDTKPTNDCLELIINVNEENIRCNGGLVICNSEVYEDCNAGIIEPSNIIISDDEEESTLGCNSSDKDNYQHNEIEDSDRNRSVVVDLTLDEPEQSGTSANVIVQRKGDNMMRLVGSGSQIAVEPSVKQAVNQNSNKRKILACESCEFTTVYYIELKNHTKTAHPKRHKCESCDYTSKAIANVRIHNEAMHLKLNEYKCELCDYTVFRKENYLRHMKTVHLKEKKYKCDYCSHRAAQKINIRRHYESVHLNLKRFKCDSCDFKTGHHGVLKRHSETVHLRKKKYKCSICEYSSDRIGDIEKHFEKVHLKMRDSS